jgi:hypothetical protein
MTTRISTHPATVPTVRVDRHTVLVGGATVGYCDLVDADRFAANLRGALADAYNAGRNDAPAWPNGHLIVVDPDARDWRRTGRCDCGGMSAHLPSHAHGPITDTRTFGRILAGRDPQTGAPR